MKAAAVIAAAGNSRRFGRMENKLFAEIAGRPLLAWTISRFETATSVQSITLVVSEEHMLSVGHDIVDRYEFSKVKNIVSGGNSRRESVLNGLEALSTSTDFVAIHDGARPLVLPLDIDRVVEVAVREKAAILAIPATDALKKVSEGTVVSSVSRSNLWLAQTPQVFDYEIILEAHRSGGPDDVLDDAALVEQRGVTVRIVEPTGANFKVTHSNDIAVVEAYLLQELKCEPSGRPRI